MFSDKYGMETKDLQRTNGVSHHSTHPDEANAASSSVLTEELEPNSSDKNSDRRPAAEGAPPPVFESIDPRMRRALALARKVAPTNATILLLGESGTGKTVLAREVHRHSLRARGNVVTVSCPCLSAELLLLQ